LVNVLDLSKQREAEAELRKLSQAVWQSPVSVVITDPSGTIEYVNPKFTEVTGYQADEAIGQNPSILKSGKLTDNHYEKLWNTILSGKTWRGEFHNRKKNGELFWESASISPVKDADGNITHFVAVKEDITQRKQLEAEIRQQERLAAVGQLAAGIAHDFNNIMAVISLYAQLLQQTAVLQPKDKGRLDIISEQARRATALIEQILDFSRQSILERKPLNLLPFAKELVKLLERTLPENITLSVTHGDGPYTVHADPARMQQMMMNLCLNARDAMPAGGQLQISLGRYRQGEHAIRPLPDLTPGHWILLKVSDTGEGIPADHLPRIFEPFFTTKERGEGSGLGLAQVYGIVKQHEGAISVNSQPKKGSTFSIFLPALPDSTVEMSPLMGSELKKGQGECILLVEDDAFARDALSDSLQMLNYKVVTAVNGKEALLYLDAQPDDVQLILSDVMMPEMGGVALLKALEEKGSDIPVIMTSGYMLTNDLQDIRDRDLIYWLAKPAELESLAEVVAQAITSPNHRA